MKRSYLFILLSRTDCRPRTARLGRRNRQQLDAAPMSSAPLPLSAGPDSVATTRRRVGWIGGFILLGCIGAVYANSFRGAFVYDDILSIHENPTLRHLATAWFPPAD